jgi:hypothetical protein
MFCHARLIPMERNENDENEWRRCRAKPPHFDRLRRWWVGMEAVEAKCGGCERGLVSRSGWHGGGEGTPGASPLAAGILLGVLWGLWHAPVADYLGAAAPHSTYWLPFFLSFVAIVTAMRVLIVWVYSNTASLLLAWLMHFSMTASLVVLDPVQVSPAQETLWYWVYAAVLWIVVAVVAILYGKRLVRQPIRAQGVETAKTALE